MPIDRNKLEAILADQDFMALPAHEQESFLDEMSQQSSPDIGKTILNTGIEGAKSSARGIFGQGISEFIPGMESDVLKASLKQGKDIASGMTKSLPTKPELKTPLGSINPKSVSQFGVESALDPRNIVAAGTSVSSIFRPKNFGKLTRRIADIPSKSVKTLRELGPENVFRPDVESEKYIGEKLVPKAMSSIRKSIGIPEEEIVSLEGKYKGSVSPILERLKSGLSEKTIAEKGKITSILENAPLSKRIKLNNFREELTNSLSGLFKGGKVRKDIPREDLKPIKDLLDMYSDKRQVFDKTEFLRRRSRLIDLQNHPNGEVAQKATKLKDALDMDAEQFGLEGLREAKGAYGKASEMEGRFLNRNTGDLKFAESKLSKVGDSLPSQDMEALKELESYIGQPFIDELSKVNKIRNIQEQFSGTKVESLLKSAQDPKNVQVREQLKSILGNDFNDIEKALTSNRIAMEFGPRGFYPSRGNIFRDLARSSVKAYEESFRPALSKLVGKK